MVKYLKNIRIQKEYILVVSGRNMSLLIAMVMTNQIIR